MLCLTGDVRKADAITHGGIFHADEVLATAILLYVKPDMKVARIRSQKDIPDDFGGIVYDIGGGAFDHHQIGGNGVRQNGIPYASAGLVWKKYGEYIVQGVGFPDVIKGMERIDNALVAKVDARDNGIFLEDAGCHFTFSDMIELLNPAWNEDKRNDASFIQAVGIAKMVLNRMMTLEKAKQEAEQLLDEAVGHGKDGILVLSKYLPWKDYAMINSLMQDIYFVIFPSARGGYLVQCVPPKGKPMEQKKAIPRSLRGKTPDEYSNLGFDGITFVHNSGFMASASTVESAKLFAKYLMDLY